MIFFDGADPDYNEELLREQTTTALLDLRDLCLLMMHNRLNEDSGSSYEHNQLQLESMFLQKIIATFDQLLIQKFTIKNVRKQFYSDTLPTDLDLQGIFPGTGNYFDLDGVMKKGYTHLPLIKKIVTNFSHYATDDWKFI